MLKYIAFAKNPPASFTLTEWKFTLENYRRLTALNGLNDATDPNLSRLRPGWRQDHHLAWLG